MIRLAELEPVVQLTPLSELQLTPIKHAKRSTTNTNKLEHPSSPARKTKASPNTELHGEGWNVIKRWSRKQIERAVKSLMDRLYSANAGVPTPAEVTHFVRVALTNPSSSVLFPHLVIIIILINFQHCKDNNYSNLFVALLGIPKLSPDQRRYSMYGFPSCLF